MAHQYSVEIHTFIGEKLKAAQEGLAKAENDGNAKEIQYLKGRLALLQEMRQHMTEKFDLSNQKYY